MDAKSKTTGGKNEPENPDVIARTISNIVPGPIRITSTETGIICCIGVVDGKTIPKSRVFRNDPRKNLECHGVDVLVFYIDIIL